MEDQQKEQGSLLDALKTGYVAAYRSNGSLVNRIIVRKQLDRGFSDEEAEYTHIEVIGIKLKNIRYSINVTFPKVKKIDMLKHHQGRYVKILRYKNEHYEKWGRAKISWLAATKCNTRYDVLGVLAFIFKWIKQNNRLWFCNEAAVADFKTVYPRCFPMPASKTMPADFVASKMFETVWEGYI